MRRAGIPTPPKVSPTRCSTPSLRRCLKIRPGPPWRLHMTYETLLVEQRGAVTLITLNRPQALNALNSQVLADLIAALGAFDADPSQGCAVLTGSEKAFA